VTTWERYLQVRRSATAASAEVLDQRLVEHAGLISTASAVGGSSGGSVFVYGDAGGDALPHFLATVVPSYVEVADGTRSAAKMLQSLGFQRGHELVIMSANSAHLRTDLAPPEVSIGRVELQDPESLSAVAALLAVVEEMPLESALAYGRDLGRLQDLQLFAATTADGQVIATSGVRKFGPSGIVMLVQTHPMWRRRGIAGALVSHSARRAEVESVFLVATSAGRGVYKRIGFVELRAMLELLPPLR
jgi:predicted GNAT family acetyltransferase